LNVTSRCLVVAFTESPSDQAALEFQREVFEESILRETKGVIFDVSGISLMDSFMSKSLVDICRVGSILGKQTIVVGLKSAVVASLVDLEIDLSCVNTAVNIEEAIAFINPPKPKADGETIEANDTIPDEDVEPEEGHDDEDEVQETEEDLS